MRRSSAEAAAVGGRVAAETASRVRADVAAEAAAAGGRVAAKTARRVRAEPAGAAAAAGARVIDNATPPRDCAELARSQERRDALGRSVAM